MVDTTSRRLGAAKALCPCASVWEDSERGAIARDRDTGEINQGATAVLEIPQTPVSEQSTACKADEQRQTRHLLKSAWGCYAWQRAGRLEDRRFSSEATQSKGSEQAGSTDRKCRGHSGTLWFFRSFRSIIGALEDPRLGMQPQWLVDCLEASQPAAATLKIAPPCTLFLEAVVQEYSDVLWGENVFHTWVASGLDVLQ